MAGKILVTRAAGFIGSHCCLALLRQGWQVTGLDNFDPFYDRSVKESALAELRRESTFRFFEGDIRDRETVRRLVQSADLVLHLAARAGVRPSVEEPELYTSVNVRDYTHVDDIVGGVLGAVRWTEADEPAYEAFNLGESTTIRLDRLIELISGALGVVPTIERHAMSPGDVRRTFAEISKARKVLGYEPQVSIEEGVKRFVDWYRRTHAIQS